MLHSVSITSKLSGLLESSVQWCSSFTHKKKRENLEDAKFCNIPQTGVPPAMSKTSCWSFPHQSNVFVHFFFFFAFFTHARHVEKKTSSTYNLSILQNSNNFMAQLFLRHDNLMALTGYCVSDKLKQNEKSRPEAKIQADRIKKKVDLINL